LRGDDPAHWAMLVDEHILTTAMRLRPAR